MPEHIISFREFVQSQFRARVQIPARNFLEKKSGVGSEKPTKRRAMLQKKFVRSVFRFLIGEVTHSITGEAVFQVCRDLGTTENCGHCPIYAACSGAEAIEASPYEGD